jgi:hypothetical protein
MIQPFGAILAGFAIWLYACDRGNEFMPWVGLAGIACLLIPIVHAAFW